MVLTIKAIILHPETFHKVSLCSLSSPGACSVDHTGLELRDPSASASQILGLKMCSITDSQGLYLSVLSACSQVCMYTICVTGNWRGQKMVLESLELELPATVTTWYRCWIQTPVLLKSCTSCNCKMISLLFVVCLLFKTGFLSSYGASPRTHSVDQYHI